MEYVPADLTARERYKILTSFVLPRPIAWVTTVGPTGVVNAAPFSFFNVLTNIQRSGEFVVNIADEPLARAMHETSGDFPPDIGEPGYLGLKLAPSTKVTAPRLADTPWAMECKTWKTIDVNRDRQLIMGEGINFYIRDELWDRDAMRVHMDRYHPIGRMFADRYCRTDDRGPPSHVQRCWGGGHAVRLPTYTFICPARCHRHLMRMTTELLFNTLQDLPIYLCRRVKHSRGRKHVSPFHFLGSAKRTVGRAPNKRSLSPSFEKIP